MNRFRRKKEAKETPEPLVRASTDSDAPSVPPMKTSKTFRRGKKAPEPEPKPELDVANALPPSDDFRTSLLMSGLSARFSMLREQDDPKSKIGKASDDSVLFPKRQSKFNDFAFQSHGLSDIAEVASINGSIRPPFAMSRTDSYDTNGSYGSDADSTHGSIMNRSKPGEGNNLFGGRQKIYKIPVTASGSTRSLAEGGVTGMGGRALYGDDVSQSAFQKLREREREQERLERERLEQAEQEENEAQSSRPSSPPLSGYNRNRETSSTTSSGGPSNTRSSTAATSFTSQRTPSLSGSHTPITPGGSVSNGGLERSTTKARRLYETGLDQHLHEQQFSAMNRIDTLTRQRTLGGHTPPPMNSPTGMTQPVERWDRRPVAGQASMPNLRAASPSPTVTLNTFDFALKSNNIPENKPYGMASPPLSPPMSEHEDLSVLPVQPNDRGKATALGAFSKPAQPYDENKYSQRQLQMQQGRETPPLRKHSPPRAFPPRQQQQQQMGRNRTESNSTYASGRSRSNSSAQRQYLPSDRVPEPQMPQSQPHSNGPPTRSMANGAFLSSPTDSGLSSPEGHASRPQPRSPVPLDLSRMNFQDRNVNLQRPPELSQHPAHRQRPLNEAPTRRMNESNDVPSYPQITPPEIEQSSTGLPSDSPTLGPSATESGLSGMVRQHLRSDSNTSSVYGGAPSAGMISRFPPDTSEPMPHIDYSGRSNPWDTDDWDRGYSFDANESSHEPKQTVASPPALSTPSANFNAEESEKPAWEQELDAHHARVGSTETQKERQEFKNDLAERRKRVQENLKSFVETESRSTSPLPGSDWAKDGNSIKNNPLVLLKSKSSRGSLVGRPREAGQSKAMKMLGIGNTTISSSPSPSKQSFEASPLQQENEQQQVPSPPKGPGGPVIPPQTKAFRQARRDAQRDRERQVAVRHQRNPNEADRSDWPDSPNDFQPRPMEHRRDNVPPNIRTRQRDPSQERKAPPVTLSHRNGNSQESKGSVGTNGSSSNPPSRTSRDRSSSDASGRSKSRNGRYRDDLAKAMAEGVSSSSQGMYGELEPPSARFPQKSPGTPSSQFQHAMPSPMLVGPNGRSRRNSRTGPGSYFEPQKLQPGQANDTMDLGLSPRPSPTAPFSVYSTPAQPSPAASQATTPTMQGFQSQGRIPGSRKRSVNKHDISEPRFVSSTSRITTVNLPPEASLQNGMEGAPPIPPVNPMRRQTRVMFGLRSKKDDGSEVQPMPAATQSTEEMSTFSADEGDSKPKVRQKLRKSSSEGGNLNARARKEVFAQPSPAMPSGAFPAARGGSPPRRVEGGMF
ncbi:hypothetical protein LSUE1_G010262 [Lachnellula suecica]|uniref:Uncharacterized protein n=1 Tax=Lachnellula suecica TaxID=602035 RepID=A0A8T9BWE2_9HELO|nr:hypothetical protein LSUE1_G010262 [Lachnellula suecica]